ncbi:MAG: dihydropteroate synthase [Victivallaceae bacterium]|nr:dihydropteroate synthase [Victivallaceae bacterium]
MFELGKFLAGRPWPLVMGVVNATGDSFSEGASSQAATALDRALALLDDGAELLDIGGESTRPGSTEIAPEEELRRVMPLVVELKRHRPEVVLSIDTRKSEVALAALAAGVEIVNDVSMLRFDPKLAKVAAQAGAGLVIGHSRATPQDMRSPESCRYPAGVTQEVKAELLAARECALTAGVKPENIVLDPNFGFAKQPEQDLELLRDFAVFAACGPALAGVSRKSFIGALTGESDPLARLGGTVAAVLAAAERGAAFVRVHDVRQVVDALRIWRSINKSIGDK